MLVALPALAAVWVTNRAETSFVLVLSCANEPVAKYELRAGSTGSYSIRSGAKSCELQVLESDGKKVLSRLPVSNDGRYEISSTGILAPRK